MRVWNLTKKKTSKGYSYKTNRKRKKTEEDEKGVKKVKVGGQKIKVYKEREEKRRNVKQNGGKLDNSAFQ